MSRSRATPMTQQSKFQIRNETQEGEIRHCHQLQLFATFNDFLQRIATICNHCHKLFKPRKALLIQEAILNEAIEKNRKP